jgi:drug/metabolite transporter (DMT)-like permease
MDAARLAMIKVAAAVGIWGASFTAIKVAVSEVAPVTVLWTRFGIGTAVLFCLLLLKGRLRLMSPRDLIDFGILGFIGIFFHNYIQSLGLQTAAAGMTGIIVSATPIAIALLGRIFLSEKISWRQWAGILLSAFGVFVVVADGDLSSFSRIAITSPGEILVTCGIFTWAIFSVMSRKKLENKPPALAMLYTMAFGWFFTTLPFLAGGFYRQLVDLSANGWGSLAFLGVFCSALAYVFWYDGLKDLPSSQVGIFLYLSPLAAVIVAALFLGEPVTPSIAIGGVLVLFGVGIVNSGKNN